MDGDIDGTDVQVNNPLCLTLGKVGEGGIVAQKEAHALVVILDVQGGAHMGGHLIHEAEHAVVGAGVHLIHEIRLKVETQVAAFLLADGNGALLSLALQRQDGFAIVAVKTVIQHVHHGVAVDGAEGLPNADTGQFSRGTGINGSDDSAHKSKLLRQ